MLLSAQSYFQLAQAHGFWGFENDVLPRTTTEEFALDSYQNCAYGIARFAECTGKLPTRVSIVSWGFKKDRFRLHMESTLGWRTPWTFVPAGTPSNIELSVAAESETFRRFSEDMTGHEGVLGEKKAKRNPFGRRHGYAGSVPCLSGVLSWKGATPVPVNLLPWSSSFSQDD